MSYAFTSGSSQCLTATLAAGYSEPLTLCCIGYPTTTSGNRGLVNISVAGVASFRDMYITGGNALVSVTQVSAGNATVTAVASPTMSQNTSYSCAAVFASATSRSTYLDGANKTSTTQSRAPGSTDLITIGARKADGTLSLYMSGRISEVALWSAALTDDEVASLGKGFSPRRICPQSLVFYAPLIRAAQDTRGGVSVTNNNTATVADHPRVY